MRAMANRNSAEALVPMMPPTAFSESKREVTRRRGERDADRQQHHDRRMAEREEEADPDRPLALLHELARDVVDRRDMIGVDRVAQAERIGEQRRAEQDRLTAQGDERPEPDENIAADQTGVDSDQSAAQISATLIRDVRDNCRHDTLAWF